MRHPIFRVTSVEYLGNYQLRIEFDDGSSSDLDLEPALKGELYRPLRDPALFAEATVDTEVHTLVWPNGADFDPAILRNWPRYKDDMRDLAHGWSLDKRSSRETASKCSKASGSDP